MNFEYGGGVTLSEQRDKSEREYIIKNNSAVTIATYEHIRALVSDSKATQV